MLNQFPLWKNLLLIGAVILSFIYAVPNLFGDDPAVQISGTGIVKITPGEMKSLFVLPILIRNYSLKMPSKKR
jgi:hypothetical protein